MNLVWIAILAIVAGDRGSASRPIPHGSSAALAPSAEGAGPSISPSTDRSPRRRPSPAEWSDGDVLDVDENDPTGTFDLDRPGPGPADLRGWDRPGSTGLAGPPADRPAARPAFSPLRC